jgi:hypothetical protein
VGYEVYRIRTKITEGGSKVDAGYHIDKRDRDYKSVGLIFPRIDLCKNMAEELRVIFSEIICKWFDEFPNDSEIEGLKKYYEWNPNNKLEIMCERDFKSGIVSLSKKIA